MSEEENKSTEFDDLSLDSATAKELDRLESETGIRPDFVHKGSPGFMAKDENEWFNNMKADRQRLRFATKGKIQDFMQKHPGRTFMVKNPKKGREFMYPVNRRKR